MKRKKKNSKFKVNTIKCPRCRGSGHMRSGDNLVDCARCNGRGRLAPENHHGQ